MTSGRMKPTVNKAKSRPKKSLKRKVKNKQNQTSRSLQHRLFLLSIEIFSLSVISLITIVFLLGSSANWFSGTQFLTSLLPFAAGVLGLIVFSAFFLTGWLRLRKWLQSRSFLLPAIVSLCFAFSVGWVVVRDDFSQAFAQFRILVGGKTETRRVTLAHQVYAAYRRYDHKQLELMIRRGQKYHSAIVAAAQAFDLDPQLLQGLAATESSFRPRRSHDSGYGLFQITRIPKPAQQEASRRLDVARPLLNNAKHNAYLAAATLKYYLSQMQDDLFLGLLAYNIGPANGGLRFIMQQYGATDFVTIQPYLQKLPRDYPVRVLSYALAFRLWEREGRILAYEKSNNAMRIQRIGIPGLAGFF